MKVEIEALSAVERKLSIELPWETIKSELNEAYKGLAKRASVKGFRAGKVPRKVLERMYQRTVENEVVTRLLDESYRDAVKMHELFTISQPHMETFPEIQEGEPLRFEVDVQVKPDIDVANYKGLAVERKIREVTDKEVEAELRRMQEQASVIEPITDRVEAQSGDQAVVDFFGKIDGEDFKGGKGINYTVALGSNSMIPGFEAEIIGMKIGEQKQFSLTFPESYHADDVKGKTADWTVDLKELKSKQVPELDDEFAKDLGEFDSLAELKENLQKNLATREDAKSRADLREAVARVLIENNPVDVPPAMTDNQLDFMMREVMQMAKGNNSPEIQEILKKLRDENRGQAEEQMAAMLILESVVKKEEIEVTDEEIDARIQELAREHRTTFQKLKNQLKQNNQIESLRYELQQERALDLVIEHAEVTDRTVSPEEAEAETAEAAKAENEEA